MKPCSHKRKPGHKPVADCFDCWITWMEESPDAVITAKDFRRIMVGALDVTMIKSIAWDAYRDLLERKIKGEYI